VTMTATTTRGEKTVGVSGSVSTDRCRRIIVDGSGPAAWSSDGAATEDGKRVDPRRPVDWGVGPDAAERRPLGTGVVPASLPVSCRRYRCFSDAPS
jgi:hypothetical protein